MPDIGGGLWLCLWYKSSCHTSRGKTLLGENGYQNLASKAIVKYIVLGKTAGQD